MPQFASDLGVYSQREFRVGEAVSKALEVFSRNAVPFSLVGIVVWLPLGIATMLAMQRPPQQAQAIIGGASLLYIFLQLAVVAAILHATFQDMRRREVNMGESIQRGLKRFFPLLGTGILLFLGLVLGAAVLIVPGAVLTRSNQQMGVVVTVLGVIVVVVSMFILLARWYVFAPVCVVEKEGPFGSLKRSAALTQGNRWKLFAIYLLLTLVGGVASVFIKFVLTAALPIVGIVASGLWQGVFSAFNNVLSVVIYHDLRVAKEGVDIESIASVFD